MLALLVSHQDGLESNLSRLKVTWYDTWHPALDEALRFLPEMETCPNELFRMLMRNPSPVRKRCALVTEQDVPVAVVGLRQRGRLAWELVTDWIIPAAVFPAGRGCLIPALEKVGREVWVAWWRMGGPPPPSRFIRHLETTPTCRLHCADDFERYWRNNGYFKTIRRIRNRCRDFKVAVNLPGSTEWTIRHWEAKWRAIHAKTDPSLTDRLVAAEYLQDRQQHYTIMLLDGDRPIGGATMTVDHHDLVAGVLYREPAYDSCGVGDRLIELSLLYAVEHGFETFDLGGGHDYKQNWAPQEGAHWQFSVCPDCLYRLKNAARWVRQLPRRVVRAP